MERLSLFASDVFVFRPADAAELNAALLPALLDESRRQPTQRASEVGGWHSRADLAQRSEPAVRAVMERIVGHGNEVVRHLRAGGERRSVPRYGWMVEAWAVVLASGGYHRPHHHAPAHLSAVWYVDAGDPAEASAGRSGWLAFSDPRGAVASPPAVDLWPSTFEIRPESGMLVLFPSFLQHYVHPYAGERSRVCISANLRLQLRSPSGRGERPSDRAASG